MLRCCIPFIAISSHVLLADQCKLADKKSKKKNFWGSTKCISGESCVPLTREPFSLLPILTTTPELHQMPFVNFFIKNKPVMLDSYRKKWCVAFQVDLFSLSAHMCHWCFECHSPQRQLCLLTFSVNEQSVQVRFDHLCMMYTGRNIFLCGFKNSWPWCYPPTLLTSALHFQPFFSPHFAQSIRKLRFCKYIYL